MVLGVEDTFDRSMSLWGNFARGSTPLPPLVGVSSLFALALSVGRPSSVWWIFIVSVGQLLVSLIFGEVVSQFPIHGGIYRGSGGSMTVATRGWRPAGPSPLDGLGFVVNVLAFGYGDFAMVLLANPGTSGDFVTEWIVLIGLICLFRVRPDRHLGCAGGGRHRGG